MQAKLALQDGSIFTGRGLGFKGEKAGEIVFNTSMTGYQEIMTDPSYAGQIVTMTYPLIGNYGINDEDIESNSPKVEGFIAREFSRIVSNFRADTDMDNYLRDNKIVGIDQIDTRALTRKLRISGSMNGVLSTVDLDDASLLKKARALPNMEGLDLVKGVTCRSAFRWHEAVDQHYFGSTVKSTKLEHHVIAIDYGMKYNILRFLIAAGCQVTVVPADYPVEKILAEQPDGIFLSNGPGDPAAVTYAIETVRQLCDTGIPLFGICLGHQILSLALGAKTYKLKFGHRGANHPVKDLTTNKIEITSQNHGFAVDDSTMPADLEVTHINLNDKTIEGMRHLKKPIFSVQYHPEASPGPHDACHLFNRFVSLIRSTAKQSV